MGYADQPFSERVKTLGDAAEAVFEEVAPLGRTERFGWRRPSVSMQAMTPTIRHQPDYYASTGWLVEVMGCGRDGIVKLKEVKYEALLAWNKIQQVALFVSNSSTEQWVLAPLNVVKLEVRRARARGDVDAFENDGNVFFKLPFASLVEHSDSIGGET